MEQLERPYLGHACDSIRQGFFCDCPSPDAIFWFDCEEIAMTDYNREEVLALGEMNKIGNGMTSIITLMT
ncbi:hypothetical protein [Bhargavaea massiliensis]|uniref:hypothetical protein n=1 Tax=Bhargavaea massiliensis TaxID=2697500 RepID=UPI001BCDC864|nr:hypothetical protein [Bhargavaea massiliensis]